METVDVSVAERRGSGRRDRLVGASVLLLGAAIIVWLTRYNLTGFPLLSEDALALHHTWAEYLIVNVSGLLFVPCLLIFGFLGESMEAFGVRNPDRPGVRMAWLFFVLMLPVLIVASRYPVFYFHYPMFPPAGYAWPQFVAFEVTYGFYFFCWEFFYRGFLTFGIARLTGFPIAIVLQAIGFGIMHIGKPAPEMYSAFAGGLILGWLALRSRSFLPGFCLHWAISATFDVLTIHARGGGLF